MKYCWSFFYCFEVQDVKDTSRSHSDWWKKGTTWKTLITALLCGFVLTGLMVVVYYHRPTFLQSIEFTIYDVLLRATTALQGSGTAAIVEIDDRSIEELGQWPWSRYRIALLLEKIRQSGAATVAIAIFFAEQSFLSGRYTEGIEERSRRYVRF